MPLAISDDLLTVRGAGGERTPVQGSGPLCPRLKVPVLRRSDQDNWFSGSRSVLSNTEAKKAVVVVATQFYHGSPGLQVEGEGGGEEGQEEEEGEDEGDVVVHDD